MADHERESAAIAKIDALQIALEKAWGLTVALHGQFNGTVRSPIDSTDKLAAICRVVQLIDEADEIARDPSIDADEYCMAAGCTASLIKNWMVSESEGGDRLTDKPTSACIWVLVDQLEAAVAASKSIDTEAAHA